MNRPPRQRSLLAVGLATMALATFTVSCIESSGILVERSAGPITRGELVGFYVAVSMVSTDGAVTTDLLAAGATLNLTLGENAAVAGHLFIPAGAEGGGAVDADMAGAWTFEPIGQTVRFVQQGDTFVRDTEFEASRDGFAIELRGNSAPEPPPPGTPGAPGPSIEVVLRTGG